MRPDKPMSESDLADPAKLDAIAAFNRAFEAAYADYVARRTDLAAFRSALIERLGYTDGQAELVIRQIRRKHMGRHAW
jgi:hypothetical protein